MRTYLAVKSTEIDADDGHCSQPQQARLPINIKCQLLESSWEHVMQVDGG